MYKSLLMSLSLIINLIYFSPLKANTALPPNQRSMELQILAEINTYRQQHHLSPLNLDPHISKQAEIHSANMAEHKIPFGHSNFLKRVGLLHKQIKGSGAAAENVAFNYKAPKILVSNWLQSPGHKRNIVGNYNLTGIGIAHDAQGKPYYTQLFINTNQKQHARRGSGFPTFSISSILKRTNA